MSISGWIGVDLDGTLAEYDGWKEGKIGRPVPLMLERVKAWLRTGVEVRIFTARVCRMDEEERMHQERLIQDWCREHLGTVLVVTNEKDWAMVELWDDRCVAVEINTGRVLGGRSRADKVEAEG